MKQSKKNRQGTNRQGTKTDTPPIISCGTRQKELLRYMFNNPDKYFYVRNYSKLKNIPRSSIYDIINRLIEKGLINKARQVTVKGKKYLGVLGVPTPIEKSLRWGCRSEQLSTHYLKYKLLIAKRENYTFDRLKELDPKETKQNKLKNFTEDYVYFQDSTVVIKSNTIIIHIHDIIASKVEEAHLIAFEKALAITVSLNKIGLKTSKMTLSQAHYARVESYLSKKLHKIDKKYFLDLGNGGKFWIDFSDKREDETNSALYRERVDELFLDLKDSKSVMSDVDQAKDDLDKMKEITLNQIKAISAFIQLEQVKQGLAIENNATKKIKDKSLMNYFG